jgi:hypothetical protein
MSERPVLTTRLAHAGFAEHRLRGHLVFGELLGNTSYWSLLSIAAGGPPLDEEASSTWDDLAVVCAVADPRIWPLKLVRLAAAYGSEIAGIGCAHLFTDRALVGPGATLGCARQLIQLREVIGADVTNATAVADAVLTLIGRERLLGFGVPYRDRDERVVAVLPRLAARGRLDLHHRNLLGVVEEVTLRKLRLPVNIVGLMAAVALDMSLPPEVAEALAVAALFPPLLGNAWESAATQESLLQRLPDAAVEYRGTPPRESPRALAARESPRASATRGR